MGRDWSVPALVLISATWFLFALFAASSGIYTGDELVYAAMISDLVVNGRLTLQNGYELFQSPELLFEVLRPGSGGLVAQYPHGFAFLAAPFWAIGDERGIVVLNTLSTIAVMALTWLTAHRLFLDHTIARFSAITFALSTFAADYAFAIWPHALSNAFVWFAVFCVVSAWRVLQPSRAGASSIPSDTTDTINSTATAHMRLALAWVFAAGLSIGFGTSVRADAILAAPILLVWVLIFARKPFSLAGFLMLGLMPGLLFCSLLNQMKFDHFIPISYGQNAGGGTNISNHARLLPLAAMGAVAAIALGFQPVRSALSGTRWIAAVAVLAIAVLAFPATRDLVVRLASGGYVLGIDMQSLDVTRFARGVSLAGGGTILLHGYLKKSLLQSMPYIGLLVILLPRFLSKNYAPQLVLLLMLVVMWMMPFSLGEWHGGLSNNMRYLSPTLPALTILAGLAYSELRSHAKSGDRVVMYSCTIILMVVFAAAAMAPNPFVYLQTGLAVLIGAVLAIGGSVYVCIVAARKMLAGILMGGLFAGLALAAAFGSIWDVGISQKARTQNAWLEKQYLEIESRSFVYALGTESMLFQLRRPQAILAIRPLSKPLNISLIDKALTAGLPIYVQTETMARKIVATRPQLRLGRVFAPQTLLELYELKPAYQ